METRIIEVKVNGFHLSKSSNLAGVQGESKVTAMRIEFDDGWDGYAKVITWLDAKGEVATQVMLTVADSGLSTLEAERVYMTLIPGEAMTHVGENMFAIDGYISGKRQKSVYGKLIVRPGDDFSDVRDNEIDWEEVTPEIALQIQAQIETLSNCIAGSGGAADKAKTSENNAKISENNAKVSEDNAKMSEDNAKVSENKAKDSEDNAKVSEHNAYIYWGKAADCEKTAVIARDETLKYMRDASSSANVASRYGGNKAEAICFDTERAKEIHISNSAVAPFKEMYLYGKSEQNGTPTPSNPVPITHLTNPTLKVLGGDSLVYETILTSDEYGTMEIDLRPIEINTKYRLECDIEYVGEETTLYFEALDTEGATCVIQEEVIVNSGGHISLPFNIEQYIQRIMNVYNKESHQFTLNNLRIVKVQEVYVEGVFSSIGDVSDYISMYDNIVTCNKRIGSIQGSGIDQADIEMIEPCLFKVRVDKKAGYNNFLTSHYAIVTDTTADHSILKGEDYGCSGDSEYGYLYIKDKECATLEQFASAINDCEFVYEMMEPSREYVSIETEQMKELYTGYPFTDIQCDAEVKVTYRADTTMVYKDLIKTFSIAVYDEATKNLKI